MKFLGFIISTNSISINPDKVLAVKNWKIPTIIKRV